MHPRWGKHAKDYKKYTFVRMTKFPWIPFVEGEFHNFWIKPITRPFFTGYKKEIPFD